MSARPPPPPAVPSVWEGPGGGAGKGCVGRWRLPASVWICGPRDCPPCSLSLRVLLPACLVASWLRPPFCFFLCFFPHFLLTQEVSVEEEASFKHNHGLVTVAFSSGESQMIAGSRVPGGSGTHKFWCHLHALTSLSLTKMIKNEEEGGTREAQL